jgi:hypothetical protein
MAKFRFLIVDPLCEVVGTNDEKVALALADSDENIVIDSQENKVIVGNDVGADLIEIAEQTLVVLG